jgi:CRP/FNR family transcriptional regulator
MEEIFDGVPERKLHKGQILIYEGDAVRNIYRLMKGYVKVSYIQPNGSHRTIIIYGPEDLFPLVSFLSGSGITRYFYECMTNVELQVMPHQSFQDKIRGDLELGEKLITYSYTISLQFAERIEVLSAHSSRHKVASLLSYLAAKTGRDDKGQVRLDIPLTSQSIADMCGLTRETASVQLQQLKEEGVISGRRNLSLDMRKLDKLLKQQ